VLMQLATSSTGATTIQMEIMAKCAADFVMLQMVPVTLAGPSQDYSQYSVLINPYTENISPSLLGSCSTLTLSTATTSALTAGVVSTEGIAFQYEPLKSNHIITSTGGSLGPFAVYTDADGEAWTFNTLSPNGGVPTTVPVDNNPFPLMFTPKTTSQLFIAYNSTNTGQGTNVTLSMYTASQHYAAEGMPVSTAGGSFQVLTGDPSWLTQFMNPITVTSSGESLVFFTLTLPNPLTGNTTTLQSMTTQGIAQIMKAGILPRVPHNTALLFELIDGNTGLPLCLLKFYPGGYFTTPTPSVQTEINLAGCYLTYLGTAESHVPTKNAAQTYRRNRATARIAV
jgi:hypothetical protein